MVLRLKGTNSDVAKQMIAGKEKDLNIFYNEDFDSAAQQVCSVVNKWIDQEIWWWNAAAYKTTDRLMKTRMPLSEKMTTLNYLK